MGLDTSHDCWHGAYSAYPDPATAKLLARWATFRTSSVDTETRMSREALGAAMRRAVQMPGGVHIVATSMQGQTAQHLHDVHGIEPVPGDSPEARKANLAEHFAAHRRGE